MARITKYLLLALIVALALNHAARAQEEGEEPAQEAETGETEAAAEEPVPQAETEAEHDSEHTVGSALEEEDNFSLGSIKKVGSWLSKFGWWNIWKGIGLKKAGDWWKWDKIFKEDWWKKKWFVLGSPLEEEESRMMLVLSEPETRSMGVNAEEDATYFLAPPGFENELAKRGIAVNPSIVPVKKTQKKQHQQRTQQQQPQQRAQQQPQQRSQQHYPQQLQNTQYSQSWLQRAFPSLDVYDREGGQGSEIDAVRMRPNTQSLSRSMVASLKKQIPDIIPLGSSAPNTPMYAYDQSGIMRLLPQETPLPLQQQYEMMNEDTQNPAVLQEYQQARTGFQDMAKNKKTEIPKRIRANSKTEPEGLIVPMPYPRSNSITTKEEIERALNNEQTQKMLEQYARKNWKTIRKDAIILKFVPKADLEARPSVKRQATMIQEQIQMPRHQSPEEINTAYARDFHQWTAQQERAMQEQQFSQLNPSQMQTSVEQQPREEAPQPAMQQAPLMPQGPQEHRQMMTQTPQQILQQEPRQSFNDQTSLMQQQPIMQEQFPINQNQQHAMIQQEPRQWLQEQPIAQQQMPRQWIQEQPQQHSMFQQETMPQNEPRQWVQEQQWTSVNPSILNEFKPRQMTQHTLDQTQSSQPQQTAEGLTMSDGGKIDNKDDQHPIVSEMGPQTEENARFFKKVLLKKKMPSSRPQYVTHNVNIYNSDTGYGSGGYGGSGYGRGASYDGGSNPGYESSHGGSYGENNYGSQGSGYGGSSGPSYGSSGHSGSYGQDHSSNYGAGGYGTSGSSGYDSSPGGSYGSHGAGYGGSSGPGYGSSGHSGSYGQEHNSNYGGGHGGYGTGGHSGYGSSPAGSYGSSAPSYGSSGSYGGGHSGDHGGSYGTGHSGGYGAGHGSNYGGGHGGGYRTAEIADTPMATIF